MICPRHSNALMRLPAYLKRCRDAAAPIGLTRCCRSRMLLVIFTGTLMFVSLVCANRGLSMEASPFAIRHPVPELPDNVEWLNTAGPLRWEDLRGKFVLIDFWTYCCINCMHIIPELKKLEAKYPRELVVIGVHSAKFDEERDSENIKQAILRYGIEHPVVNDHNMTIWRRFGVNAWPTLVLIDPEGFVVWGQSGETTFEALDQLLRPAIAYYEKRGTLDRTPIHFETLARRFQPTPLRFPGKILVDSAGNRLFIADSGHHRIVVSTLEGDLLAVIGTGEPGFRDGEFSAAQFSSPQGMALLGQVLLVADTENHAIRAVDLEKRVVKTVAGTGVQLRRPPTMRMETPLSTELSSPWDLCVVGEWVYIAMAGCHQIWRMDTQFSQIGPYAGNAREDIVDGPLLPPSPYALGFASFAQPSGLATDGRWLYVADSEGSSIRAVPLQTGGEVRTVVGTARLMAARLFTFGDRDGPAPQVLLQHPIGLCYAGKFLYVADTYNNKIKRVNPETGETVTVAGDSQPGNSDDPPRFDEPAGISPASDTVLYVADTNNHAIRRLELAPAVRVTTLIIKGLQAPQVKRESEPPLADVHFITREKVSVRLGSPVKIRLDLWFPPDHGLNLAMPVEIRVRRLDQSASSAPSGESKREFEVYRVTPQEGPIEIELSPLDSGTTTLEVVAVFYWCEKSGRGLCRIGIQGWRIPIEVSDGGANTLVLEHTVGS
ncbi:thioredoxin-like domain-containing protein [Thermogutta sp.]|uniref:thioredoxin-like domain-containing protein n=1 Tax=Thermogutta sp. TaxID=1962930 RepID=UPI00321FD8A0